MTREMTDNAPQLGHVHDRSPVILAPQDWQTWLNAPLADLYQFDQPWPANDVIVNHSRVSRGTCICNETFFLYWPHTDSES